MSNHREWKAGDRIVYMAGTTQYPGRLIQPTWNGWAWVLLDYDRERGWPPQTISVTQLHLAQGDQAS